jgi:hypothetical protein
MLVQFKVANFRSFGSEVTLSLEAVKAFKEHAENVVETDGYRLLRSAAIYGANASGKTNLVKAMSFMREFVRTSASKNSVAEIGTEPFRLNKENQISPSLFEAIFLIDGSTYRYGFEVTKKEVCTEWLLRGTGPRNKEHLLFKRDQAGVEVSDAYQEGKGKETETRSNALFLSTVDQRNGPVAHLIVQWFDELTILLGSSEGLFERLSATMIQVNRSGMSERVLAFIRQIDDSIVDLISLDIPEFGNKMKDGDDAFKRMLSRQLLVRRRRSDGIHEDFNLERDESAGTKKLLWLAFLWLTYLDQGSIAFVDEMEARLHPQLTRRLVRLFNSAKTNPKNAQLVFVTHDTNLLTYGGLRRDQVWFCEKNRKGSTDLYSLAEIKVRKGARFENDYIGGKYGAIPYFGNVAEVGGETE